jgi:hypothetical protein
MKRAIMSAAIVSAFILGCVTATHVVQSARADGAEPSGAKECFAVTTWAQSGKSINDGASPERLVRIPAGWDIVGSGGSEGGPVVMLCRAI